MNEKLCSFVCLSLVPVWMDHHYLQTRAQYCAAVMVNMGKGGAYATRAGRVQSAAFRLTSVLTQLVPTMESVSKVSASASLPTRATTVSRVSTHK